MKKITIEVDESLIPQGYEIVAFREASADDVCICILDGGIRTGAEWNSTGLPAMILKKKPWRAKKGGEYSFIDDYGQVVLSTDDGTPLDDRLYELGNYYPPRSEELLQAQKRVQAAYRVEGE